MDKDSLEIAVWGMTVKAIGTRAMVILAGMSLVTVAIVFLFGGPQLIAMLAAFS